MMERSQLISEKWIKAAVVGTTWAASEIVLGSFLHNLRIPFSSNILTAIGIVILISVSYIWREKGLYWRAGLICALMKTMSPSAVIFGPMVAIFSQALLLEVSVRILGKNIFGFVTGAVLAMTWNLFHKVANFIIFYGYDIVGIYSNLLQYAQKQLRVDIDMVWGPIYLLLAIYALLGVITAIIGIQVGRRVAMQPTVSRRERAVDVGPFASRSQGFPYSIWWLLGSFFMMTAALVVLNLTSWKMWGVVVLLVTSIWIFRYKRALRQLLKPRFWVSFVVITMLTAFVFSKIQQAPLSDGMLAGVQMNARAIIVILGFSVLGTELYNPVIRRFFMRTTFRQLPLALELSFETLPSMIASVPDLKVLMRNPVQEIYSVLSQIEWRLEEARRRVKPSVWLITGPVGAGKSDMLNRVIEKLRRQNIKVAGIVSKKVVADGQTAGFDIVDLLTGTETALMRLKTGDDQQVVGRFVVLPEGISAGTAALEASRTLREAVIFIDEVGKLELEGRGWSHALERLLAQPGIRLVIAIRQSLASEIIQKWHLQHEPLFTLTERAEDDVVDRLAASIVGQ